MNSSSRTTTWLGGILALAFLLRVWGIDFGLPHELTYDEIHEILRALKLGTGQYQWSFGKGGLYYLLFAEYGLLYLVWWALGEVSSPRDFAIHFVQDPSAFYLLGRITVAMMGVATIWVVFAVGRRIYGEMIGLGAAIIGATAYYHGFASHIVNVDVGMTLALWASVLTYLRFEESANMRWLAASGVLAGIAIAFKLPGGIVLFVLLCAIVSSPGAREHPARALRTALVGCSVMLVTLTIVAPEWIPSLGSMSSHFTWESAPPGGSGNSVRNAIDSLTIAKAGSVFSYLSIAFLPHNILLTLTAIAGCILGARARDRWSIIWILMIVSYLLIMSAGERSPHQRYLMPLSPALWLLASRVLITLGAKKRWVIGVGLAAVVSLPLAGLVYQDYMLTRPDTRIVAKDWIELNVPSGAKILMDGMRYRFVMSPPLHPDEESIERLTRRVSAESSKLEGEVLSYAQGEPGWGGGSALAWQLYKEAMADVDRPAYTLYSTVYGLRVERIEYYLSSCFDYIITSSDISKRFTSPESKTRFPESADFYERVKQAPGLREVYSVAPAPWRMRGPTLNIYELDSDCG